MTRERRKLFFESGKDDSFSVEGSDSARLAERAGRREEIAASIVNPRMNESLQKLLEIDQRHNELLDRLAELDAKVLSVLEDWTHSKQPSSASNLVSSIGSKSE